MRALTNAILSQYPAVCGRAVNPLDLTAPTLKLRAPARTAPVVKRVIMHGRACRAGDPLLREGERESRIVKDLAIGHLSRDVAKWLERGRKIDSIHAL